MYSIEITWLSHDHQAMIAKEICLKHEIEDKFKVVLKLTSS